MVGERTGKSYKLGESIRITVSAVDKLTKTIDFTIADDSDAADKTGDASEKKVVDAENAGKLLLGEDGVKRRRRKASQSTVNKGRLFFLAIYFFVCFFLYFCKRNKQFLI